MIATVLQHRYVFAPLAAILTATLSYALARVTERDPQRAYRTFFKTLVSGLVAGLALAWLASPAPEQVATVPFDVAPFAAASVPAAVF